MFQDADLAHILGLRASILSKRTCLLPCEKKQLELIDMLFDYTIATTKSESNTAFHYTSIRELFDRKNEIEKRIFNLHKEEEKMRSDYSKIVRDIDNLKRVFKIEI
jgi:hypothetical protein